MSRRAVPPAESRIDVAYRSGVWILTLHGEHDIATRPSLAEECADDRAVEEGPAVVALDRMLGVHETLAEAFGGGSRR